MCGLDITVADGEVTLIRGNKNDTWSKGYLCPKGTALGHLHHDPDRLRVPMIRDGDGFREATWDEAFAECTRLLRGVIDTHGIEAVTAYIGNPTAHNASLGRYIGALTGMSGMPMIYSAGTVDQWPKNVSSALMYGATWSIPVPDLPNTDLIIMMGANPHASQGSIMACADVLGHLDAIVERGGEVIVIDPRRTGTVDHATEWLPIVPGTDAALLAAVCNELFATDRVDLGAVTDQVKNLDRVRAAVAPFTPDAVAESCGISADRIQRLATQLADTDRAVVYGRIGTCNQEFGTLASWLVDVANILTGHFDIEGGAGFPEPVVTPLASLSRADSPDGYTFGRWTSRVRGAPEVLGQVPVSCLAEEIDTPGAGQLKALITVAGNPVISAPNAERLDAALPSLECMISIDNWINETTRHAHVILPGASPLEALQADDLLASFAVATPGRVSPPVFEPPTGTVPEWQILLHLGAIFLGMGDSPDLNMLDNGFTEAVVGQLVADKRSAAHGQEAADIVASYAGSDRPQGVERFVDIQIRTGPYGDGYGARPEGLTLDKLLAEPNGILIGPMPTGRTADVVRHGDGKIDLAPPYILADLPRLGERLVRDDEGLLLVSRRHVRSNNSWMHNVRTLVKGKDRCTLLVHPIDAAASNLDDGALATVQSAHGSLEVPVEISDEMMPGVVSLPHGWGHNKAGTQMSIANEHPGVNNNLLAIPNFVDALSGNAAVNGIPVELSPA